jgi:hypothetical protein
MGSSQRVWDSNKKKVNCIRNYFEVHSEIIDLAYATREKYLKQ